MLHRYAAGVSRPTDKQAHDGSVTASRASGAPIVAAHCVGQRVTASRFFEAVAGRYERSYALSSSASRARMPRVLAHLRPASRVLDLGVGTGRELTALQDAGHDVVGLDVSQAMLDRCARRARPVPLVCADLWATLPFPSASFDAVLALHGTLAHPESDDRVTHLASEIRRVLRPEGVWLAELPSPAWLGSLDREPDAASDLGAVRVGEDRFLHFDRVVGLALEGVVYTDARWSALVGRDFRLTFEAREAAERLVVATRLG